MNFDLVPASDHQREVVTNLMQLYIYDFSEYVDCDVEDNGLFPAYHHLEDYWNEPGKRFPYLIKSGSKYIGFALVRLIENSTGKYFSIAEFFVMRKYRRHGIGQGVATRLFDIHKGKWEVYQKKSNKPAFKFWKHTIHAYTKGQFAERSEDGRTIQDFES